MIRGSVKAESKDARRQKVTEFEATLTRMDTRVISDGPLVIAAALLSGFALSALMSMFSASSIESYTGSSSDGAARLYAAACVLWSFTFSANLFTVITTAVFGFNYYQLRNRLSRLVAHAEILVSEATMLTFVSSLDRFLKTTLAHRSNAALLFNAGVPTILTALLLTVACKQYGSLATSSNYVAMGILGSAVLCVAYTMLAIRTCRKSIMDAVSRQYMHMPLLKVSV